MLTLFFRSSHWKRNRDRAETTENRQIMRLRWNVSKGCKSAISRHIIKPLPTIYIQCFLPDIIPDELKLALVTPVYKANEKELFSNYRPISVRPCFSKILEKLIYKRVLFFLFKHKILTDIQYGFRENLSTNFQFLSLCKDM